MKRVGFVLKRGSREAETIARELAAWATARGCQVIVGTGEGDGIADVTCVPDGELVAKVDLLVVLGGDGTLLHGAGLVAEAKVPLLGINLGTLGFLTQFDPREARDALGRALDGTLAVEERMRLTVTLRATSGETASRHALNDAVISKWAMPRLIEVRATLDDDEITRYKADGLIVATPTGSTAYNLAAGGPILTPGQAAISITPICPHTLTNRPLVVPATARVCVQVEGESHGAILSVDGQWARTLGKGDVVDIAQAATPLVLYRSGKTYFEILREKLKWGEREPRKP